MFYIEPLTTPIDQDKISDAAKSPTAEVSQWDMRTKVLKHMFTAGFVAVSAMGGNPPLRNTQTD